MAGGRSVTRSNIIGNKSKPVREQKRLNSSTEVDANSSLILCVISEEENQRTVNSFEVEIEFGDKNKRTNALITFR